MKKLNVLVTCWANFNKKELKNFFEELVESKNSTLEFNFTLLYSCNKSISSLKKNSNTVHLPLEIFKSDQCILPNYYKRFNADEWLLDWKNFSNLTNIDWPQFSQRIKENHYDYFLIWGDTAPASRILELIAIKECIPYSFIERGHLSETIQFSQNGTGIKSLSLEQPFFKLHKPNSSNEKDIIDTTVEHYCEQYSDESIGECKNMLSILFLGCFDNGAGIKKNRSIGCEINPQAIAPFFGVKSSLEAAKLTIENLPNLQHCKILLTLRPHPYDPNRSFYQELGGNRGNISIKIDQEKEVSESIRKADIIIGFATTSSVFSLLYNKKLITLGSSEFKSAATSRDGNSLSREIFNCIKGNQDLKREKQLRKSDLKHAFKNLIHLKYREINSPKYILETIKSRASSFENISDSNASARSIFCFYHLFLKGDWESIFLSHMAAMIRSRLYENLKSIHILINYEDNESLEKAKSYISKYKKCKLISARNSKKPTSYSLKGYNSDNQLAEITTDINIGESEAIFEMCNHAKTNKDSVYFFLHSKGASNPGLRIGQIDQLQLICKSLHIELPLSDHSVDATINLLICKYIEKWRELTSDLYCRPYHYLIWNIFTASSELLSSFYLDNWFSDKTIMRYTNQKFKSLTDRHCFAGFPIKLASQKFEINIPKISSVYNHPLPVEFNNVDEKDLDFYYTNIFSPKSYIHQHIQ